MKFFFTFLLLLITHISVTAQCWKQTATGYHHTLAIKEDGSLWAWGSGSHGQLGNGIDWDSEGFEVYETAPIPVSPGTTWKSVATGWNHVVAIKSDGTLWTWGNNDNGQLGDGTIIDKNLPQQIGTENDWVYISCGQHATFVLKANGTLWACGRNNNGQLGDGTTVNKNTFVQIGTDNNWKSIEAGWFHTLGMRIDNTIWAWGDNSFGQIGDNTTIDKHTPVQVGNSTNWQRITAGQSHSLAIASNGTLWAWGCNLLAQLGNNTTTNSHLPIQIETDTDWVNIAGGNNYSFGIKSDGSLWSWGMDNDGLFGSGSENIQVLTPTHYNTGENWISIATNASHAIGLKSDHSISAAGNNFDGELGNGTQENSFTFITVDCPLLNTNDYKMNIGFQLYPNPVKNFLTIHNPNNLSIDNICIFDITGKIINTATKPENINLDKFSLGIYYVKITSGHQTYNYKIIKS